MTQDADSGRDGGGEFMARLIQPGMPAMDDARIAKKHTYWESNGQVTRRVRII